MKFGPLCASVGIAIFEIIFPADETIPVFILVPPKSTPIERKKKFMEIISPAENVHIYVFKGVRESVGILLPKGYVNADLPRLPNWINVHEMYGNPINSPALIANNIFYLNFSNEDYEKALSQFNQFGSVKSSRKK